MKTTTLFLFAIILNACSATGKTASNITNDTKNSVQPSLNGTYTVSNMDVDNLAENLTISFDEATNKVSGFSGCNTFFGSYTIIDNAITFKGLGSTRKMCADKNAILNETKMLTALGKTTHFETKDDVITFLNAKTELISAVKSTDNSEKKLTQDGLKVEYKASARGHLKEIILENKTISIQNGHNVKPEIKACNNEDWDMVLKMVTDINLKNINTLEPPSKAHQYDGAALAGLTITKDGETYTTPAFDAGNPNKEIKALVDLVNNIGTATKEKN